MEALIHYFENISSLHRTLILVGGLTFFWLLESAVPLFQFGYKKWRHAGINIFFTFTTILVNFVMAFMLVKSADWVVASGVGILQIIDMPIWLFLIVGLLGLDFISSWLIHFIQHKVPILWVFHVIHHSDQHIDTTSANRHHPGESVFRFLFTLMAVVVMGAPIWMVLLYQSMSALFSQFNHSNVIMPAKLDKVLMWVIVTPNMHRVHHHYRQPYSDMNYGNIFSFWDRIFGTFVEVDNRKLKYGVDTYMHEKEASDIWTMLKIPFRKYRPSLLYDQEEKLND
jgi:sterol desaturase/sphingolipid hydroxylase (fatty acid hydroxylase superfamily)